MEDFKAAYEQLNTEQKKAVDTIDGPVMVIAGPGTGKTQVLALRIANIRYQTDTPADGILCLTFTNAGVKVMRQRLARYMGPDAARVRVTTFHSFALDMIEKNFQALNFDIAPVLLDATGTVVLYDELLNGREWKHLRPRANKAQYVRDIGSLISVLKRERIDGGQFKQSILEDIERLKQDPTSISSRGESKGQLKKEIEKKIESMERTLEVATFYDAYEALKEERNVIDYNDALELLVKLVETSDDARATIREQFLYVLVDEHQDSSGIQNKFLTSVWADEETQNIFVVGDDRQLIYGFGGASLDYFKSFAQNFNNVVHVTLVHNYRSTQTILDTAEILLQSTLATAKLVGSTKESHPVKLIECEYPRDEIIRAGLDIQQKVSNGMSIDQCAILVPKNRQVKGAITVLRDRGLPVAAATSLRLFELTDTQALLNVLRVIIDPFNAVALSRSLLDPIAGISALAAHEFLQKISARKITLELMLDAADSAIAGYAKKLEHWLALSQEHDAYSLIQIIAEDCMLGTAKDDETLRRRIEIIRTLLHLALSQAERGNGVDLASYIAFIERLEEYDEDISLAVFGANKGIKVLTLHGSKGLEFDAVWIAHMDERSLMGTKRNAFTLPQTIEEKIVEYDEEVKKRQLYVALTRAKRFCTLSYSCQSYGGADQQLASIIAALPESSFVRETADESEDVIAKADTALYVTARPLVEPHDITELVREEYQNRSVSVTLLNNFFECPWKWYFRNLLQLPEPLSDTLHVGTIVHAGIEYILKSHSAGSGQAASMPSQLMLTTEIERRALVEARYHEPHAHRLAAQSLPIVMHWLEQVAPTIVRPFSTERSLPYHDSAFPNLSMFGKIDLVEELISNEVRVSDWKTGSVKTGNEIEKPDEEGRMSGLLRQLTMYSYLINGFSKGLTEVAESRLVFLEAKKNDKNASYGRQITGEDLKRLQADIADYDRLLQSGEWVKRVCHAKLYGEGEQCEYCAMARRFGIAQNS
jgi:DNA helicase-2/ATP-dependent DNA helicase PcrA